MGLFGANNLLITTCISLLLCGAVLYYSHMRFQQIEIALMKQQQVLTSFITNIENEIRLGTFTANGKSANGNANEYAVPEALEAAMKLHERQQQQKNTNMIDVSEDDDEDDSSDSDDESDGDSDDEVQVVQKNDFIKIVEVHDTLDKFSNEVKVEEIMKINVDEIDVNEIDVNVLDIDVNEIDVNEIDDDLSSASSASSASSTLSASDNIQVNKIAAVVAYDIAYDTMKVEDLRK